ncbi:NAD(P)-dependent alcohol dehydrogenase [Pseudomonas chlororaphis]|uniref:NAD(P)-dependent alcohol dehydrogenase n=1 Tax=Pseudomonas chlororaphis TaxID=587753 RepID=A0A1Q8ES49_9PSED|nr:NAD(P)-dependent alcohol dehydrogenase [Pseudomonas chlororaphis]OLF54612.1 NAD(P)-dependent alcohol dehydrogenase [Pseudomonas chlororaphis]
MQALVLEKQRTLTIREVDLALEPGPDDVRIRMHTVGICGSDVHYYTHGRIGPFVVDQPMVLGHEAAGIVVEAGANVRHLTVGDRVCMEPGIPDPASRASRLGLYNIDPAVRFWATPPVHGCLTPEVIHPAAFVYKLPDHVSFAEGALVEPFAIGMQAAVKARIKPGDIAVVIGAGTIGLMTALAALAAGASQVLVSDLVEEKLAIAQGYDGIVAINARVESLAARVAQLTGHWGADVVFEASGSPRAYPDALACVCPAGALVLVGMPVEPVAFDVVAAQAKEIRIETVFRYANVYPRAINLIASGKVDLKPLVSATFPFAQGVAAFERAASALPGDVKVQISFDPHLG